MPDRKLYKAGDTFVLPVTFQVLKTLGHEDRVFHLVTPVDSGKQLLCLKDPFFLACMEPVEPDLAIIPEEVLQRALDLTCLPDASNPEEGEDKPE